MVWWDEWLPHGWVIGADVVGLAQEKGEGSPGLPGTPTCAAVSLWGILIEKQISHLQEISLVLS